MVSRGKIAILVETDMREYYAPTAEVLYSLAILDHDWVPLAGHTFGTFTALLDHVQHSVVSCPWISLGGDAVDTLKWLKELAVEAAM